MDLSKIGRDAPPIGSIRTDDDAEREAQDLFARRWEAKKTIHYCFHLFIKVAAASFLAIFVVRCLHYVLPENKAESGWIHGWLTEGQLQAIDKIFFSGAVGALVTRHMRHILPEAPKD